MIITIDHVPYEVQKTLNPANCIQSCKLTIVNFLGMDGIEALKRANGYGDPCGYFYALSVPVLITVEKHSIEIQFPNEHFADTHIESVIQYLINAYPSVGWECLDQ